MAFKWHCVWYCTPSAIIIHTRSSCYNYYIPLVYPQTTVLITSIYTPGTILPSTCIPSDIVHTTCLPSDNSSDHIYTSRTILPSTCNCIPPDNSSYNLHELLSGNISMLRTVIWGYRHDKNCCQGIALATIVQGV